MLLFNMRIEPVHEISNNVICAQSDQSLCLPLEYPMSVKLPTEHHLRFLNLKGGYTGLSESTLVKMPHCLKSRVMARLITKSLKHIWAWAIFPMWR